MAHTQEKMNGNVLFAPEFQKKRRQLHNSAITPSDYPNLTGQDVEYINGLQFSLKAQLRAEQRKIAEQHFSGNTHAVKMTELRQETQEMELLFQKVTSIEPVKIRGKKIPLKDFATKQAFGLSQCSTKAIYQYNRRKESFKFKHSLRCDRRSCPVCQHFQGVKEGKLMLDELQNQFSSMSRADLWRGRLYHIVLSHENVPVERVFEIFHAWRHTQKMKAKVYKKKNNPYDIWNIMKWGLWRWEVTRNAKTGLYHPHLHIIAYTQNAWLAPETGDKGGKKPSQYTPGGYWYRLVNSWIEACANAGVNAEWEGQHFGPILYFKEQADGDPRCLPYDFTPEQLAQTVEGAINEMAKYAVKSTDFTKIKRVKEGEDVADIANEVAMLFALMSGRKLKNGFGGFSLRDDEEGEEPVVEVDQEPEENPEDLMEAIFVWDRKQQRYQIRALRRWNEQRFNDYIRDLQDYRDRHSLVMFYGLERDD